MTTLRAHTCVETEEGAERLYFSTPIVLYV